MANPFESSDIKRPDSAGRITLGKEYSGKTFAIRHKPNGDIVLSPVVVLHEREVWLHQNPQALKSVQTGNQQSANRETESLGSFAQFLDEED